MASTLVRPTIRQAMRPLTTLSTTRAFTTTTARLDSASAPRPSRAVLPNPSASDSAKISIWSPFSSLDLTKTIDRHIHFIHPILTYNAKGEPIGVRRPNLISARATDVVDAETGDRYSVVIKVERTPGDRELNLDWKFDPRVEEEKTVEQREREEAEREEKRQRIVRRRLALWEPVVKGHASSPLIHAVRDAVNDIHDELQAHIENAVEPEGEEFEALVEKAKELRLEHANVLKEVQRLRVQRAMSIKAKREKLKELEGKYDDVAKAKEEYEAIKYQEPARAFNPKWMKNADSL